MHQKPKSSRCSPADKDEQSEKKTIHMRVLRFYTFGICRYCEKQKKKTESARGRRLTDTYIRAHEFQ